VKIPYEAKSSATPELLWQALSQTERWPNWSNLISGVSWVQGEPWKAGSRLQIEGKDMRFKLGITVTEVAAPRRFSSEAKVMGFGFKHLLSFNTMPDGTSQIASGIEISGPAVFLISEEKKRKGLELFSEWINGLRCHAESLSS
jgi:hypothetical protein